MGGRTTGEWGGRTTGEWGVVRQVSGAVVRQVSGAVVRQVRVGGGRGESDERGTELQETFIIRDYRLHIYPLCVIFYFPWHRHQTEGTIGFQCLFRKTHALRGELNC